MSKALKAMFDRERDNLAAWTKKLRTGTNVQKHWSGKGSFKEAMRSLKGDVTYAVFYRHTSTFAHVADSESALAGVTQRGRSLVTNSENRNCHLKTWEAL